MQDALERRQIFVNENDTLSTVLKKLQASFDESLFSNELAFVFNKKNNNYVGYYLLKGKTFFYEIYFLPKIIKSDDDDKLTKFFNYLSQSYKLIEINSHKTKITSSIKNIAFQQIDGSNTNKKNNIELLIFHQYKSLLEEIYSFFKRHSKVSTKQIHFSSQSISHKIDLKRNFTSLDKSRVHQSRVDSIQSSEMALIAYGALRLFLYEKIEEFKDTSLKKQLEELTHSLISFLLQKFRLNRAFNIHFSLLLSNRNFRYFSKSQQSIDVYYHILSLFGYDPLLHKEDLDYCQLTKGNYFFFLPEKIYEYLVHNYFIQLAEEHEYEIKVEKPKKRYPTKSKEGWVFENDSQPDILVSFQKNGYICKVVIDAKWKVINEKAILKAPDLLKLERDYEVHEANQSIISYCKISNLALKNIDLTTHYTSMRKYKYRVEEISFNLATPNLKFDVDMEVISI